MTRRKQPVVSIREVVLTGEYKLGIIADGNALVFLPRSMRDLAEEYKTALETTPKSKWGNLRTIFDEKIAARIDWDAPLDRPDHYWPELDLFGLFPKRKDASDDAT